MVRFGGFLAFLGLGSALLHFTSVQFTLLMWAHPMQPYLGLGLGTVGVVILAIKFSTDRNGSVADGAPGAQPGFAPPPGGFAPPPAIQRGGQQFSTGAQFSTGGQFLPGGPQFAAGGAPFTPVGPQSTPAPSPVSGPRWGGPPPVAPAGPHPGPRSGPQGYGPPRPGPGAPNVPQQPEPVLGRPQFTPQVATTPPAPPRRQPPEQVGPQG